MPSRLLGITLAITLAAAFAQASPSVTAPAPIQVPKRLLVLAPHPDDVMESAGLIQRTLAEGGEVRVVDLTCGDSKNLWARRLAKRLGFKAHENEFVNAGYLRQAEDLRAIPHLGLSPDHLVFLGYPDGGLWKLLTRPVEQAATPLRMGHSGISAVPYSNALSPGAPYLLESVLGDLERVLNEFAPDLVTTPHPNDHHLDHVATYFLAREALARPGLKIVPPRHLAVFDRYAGETGNRLRADRKFSVTRKDIPSSTRWLELELDPKEIEAKIRLIEQYPSQMAWEHPFERVYRGHRSYLFGYVAQNELYGEVTEPRYDSKFRKRVEQEAWLDRAGAYPGNLARDLWRKITGR